MRLRSLRRAPGGLTDEALRAALGELGYTARRSRPGSQAVTFFDTYAGALARAGCSLCFRAAEGTWELQRQNGSVAVEGGSADVPVGAGPVGALLGALTRRPPRCPRVRASLEETRWAVRSSSTARVNLVVQRWSFVPPFADTPVAPLAVVGVPAEEHTGADVEYLMALLERHLVLQPEERSPDTVGAALLGLREPGGPPPADTIPLPSDSPAAAGARLLRRQALALQDTCEGAARDVDPEYVHQMRVSARRARFVLSLFGSFLGTERAAALRGELSWILGTLGPVRDMDVLAERLPDLLERVEAAASVRAGLLRVLVARRRSAFAAMKDALRGARFLALIRDLQEPPSAGEAPPSPPGSPAPTAAVFASRRIVKALSRVRDAAGADPSTLLPAELHRLRILFKRLRYTCEFFAPILTVEDVAASATVFQELLGRYQDASAAIDTLRSLAGAVPVRGGAAELTLALGALIHVHREAREKMRLRFLRTWRAHGAALLRARERFRAGGEA